MATAICIGCRAAKDNWARPCTESGLNPRDDVEEWPVTRFLSLVTKEWVAYGSEGVSLRRSVQEIAGALYLSPKTVFSHRKKLLEKTGAGNLVELVFWSLRHRLLEVS